MDTESEERLSYLFMAMNQAQQKEFISYAEALLQNPQAYCGVPALID